MYEQGREEAGLFRHLAGVPSEPKALKTQSTNSKGGDANDSPFPGPEENTRKAARLLYDIKDVRDELHILKTIAVYQQKVQRCLIDTTPSLPLDITVKWDEDQTAEYVMDDIDELDKLAKKTEDAVSQTLTTRPIPVANFCTLCS